MNTIAKNRNFICTSVLYFFFFNRTIIYNGRNTQEFGLILLLISKAAGHLNAKAIEEDKATGILHRYTIQKNLNTTDSTKIYAMKEIDINIKYLNLFQSKSIGRNYRDDTH